MSRAERSFAEVLMDNDPDNTNLMGYEINGNSFTVQYRISSGKFISVIPIGFIAEVTLEGSLYVASQAIARGQLDDLFLVKLNGIKVSRELYRKHIKSIKALCEPAFEQAKNDLEEMEEEIKVRLSCSAENETERPALSSGEIEKMAAAIEGEAPPQAKKKVKVSLEDINKTKALIAEKGHAQNFDQYIQGLIERKQIEGTKLATVKKQYDLALTECDAFLGKAKTHLEKVNDLLKKVKNSQLKNVRDLLSEKIKTIEMKKTEITTKFNNIKKQINEALQAKAAAVVVTMTPAATTPLEATSQFEARSPAPTRAGNVAPEELDSPDMSALQPLANTPMVGATNVVTMTPAATTPLEATSPTPVVGGTNGLFSGYRRNPYADLSQDTESVVTIPVIFTPGNRTGN